MPSECQTLRVSLDEALDLVIEIPGTLSTRVANPEERGTFHGELHVKGPVQKPPPNSKIGSASISTTITDANGEQKLLSFEVVLSVEQRSPPAA